MPPPQAQPFKARTLWRRRHRATIAAGATSTTFDVTSTGDTNVEADETFNITLSKHCRPGYLYRGDLRGTGH